MSREEVPDRDGGFAWHRCAAIPLACAALWEILAGGGILPAAIATALALASATSAKEFRVIRALVHTARKGGEGSRPARRTAAMGALTLITVPALLAAAYHFPTHGGELPEIGRAILGTWAHALAVGALALLAAIAIRAASKAIIRSRKRPG